MIPTATTTRKRTEYRSSGSTYGNVAFDLAYAEGGALARPLERGGAEVLRPQPKVRPRTRALTRPKVHIREQGKVSVFAVVGFLAVGVFAALLLLSYVRLTVVSDQLVAMRSQLSGLKAEESKLMTQYELAFDLSTIEEMVSADGSMVKPQNDQIIILDMSEPDSVVRFQEAVPAEEPADTSIFAELKGIWMGLLEYLP